ncbi:MAG: ferritin-like domain-containing protein [Planctomycetota bacterium]
MNTSPTPPTSRSQLLSLLSEACELEHGLLCSYLFSAFSIKQDLAERGFSWQQQQQMRLWAAQIYAVASEEMLHLAQAWNLLAAIGGTPYYYRPSFPQSSKYYRLHLPLALEPFGSAALKRFIMYELPAHLPPEDMAQELGLAPDRSSTSADLTVGELYGLILTGFQSIPEAQLFVGSPERQIGQDIVDFPDIVKVASRDTAAAAISMITAQGEGTTSDHQDCHFGMFLRILRDFEAEVSRSKERGERFVPVRNVAENPVPRIRGGIVTRGTNLIEHPYTQAVAEYFDEVYELMLRMLQFAFSSSTECGPVLRRFAETAIVVMPTVVKPIGEALTLLPMREGSDRMAGPAFGMSRHVGLPVEPDIASVVVRDRLAELNATGLALCENPAAPTQLVCAVANLGRYARV